MQAPFETSEIDIESNLFSECTAVTFVNLDRPSYHYTTVNHNWSTIQTSVSVMMDGIHPATKEINPSCNIAVDMNNVTFTCYHDNGRSHELVGSEYLGPSCKSVIFKRMASSQYAKFICSVTYNKDADQRSVDEFNILACNITVPCELYVGTCEYLLI